MVTRRPFAAKAAFVLSWLILLLGTSPALSHDAAPGGAHRAGPAGPGTRLGRMPLPDGDIAFTKTILAVSYPGGLDLSGRRVDAARVEKELDRLAAKLRLVLGDGRNPRRTVAAMNRFLYEAEGFEYDKAAGDPDNFLPDRVLSRKRGNCLGLTVLYLALAERLSLPVRGVYAPSHCFPRYEGGGVRINIETAEGGAERSDARYAADFRLTEGRPYLRTLGSPEMVAVYLKSLGAASSKRGREGEALALYRLAASYYPALPDVYYNAGVSYQKMGLPDEAIAQYRVALALDPKLAAARDNLGVALARKGLYSEALEEARRAVALAPESAASRGNLAATLCACGLIDDGIGEYRKIVAQDGNDVRALAGLANAYFSRGMYEEAISYCDRASALGCRFDPAMLSALERHRPLRAGDGP